MSIFVQFAYNYNNLVLSAKSDFRVVIMMLKDDVNVCYCIVHVNTATCHTSIVSHW